MAYWLASSRSGQETSWIQRFDPRFWTVNFPRPMMASATTPAADALRIDVSFLTAGDLAGVIWDSTDSLDHPLLAYDTSLDYSATTLSFQWDSSGVIALDQVNGPTLTIEGNDAQGNPHTWYVRLWNYATGTPTSAMITLPFSSLAGGWVLGAGSDPVDPSAISRMFISLVPPGYAAGATTPLATPVDGWATLTQMRCSGRGAMLRIGNVFVPPTGIAAATAFDDNGTQTPARLVRNLRQLGYRGSVLHYIGMSHYFRLMASGGAYLVAGSGDPLCPPTRAWHADFFARCKSAGLSPIASMSYEVLAQNCPASWQQRAANGDPALTGWSPPSVLLSPANAAAMTWLQSVATAFVGLMATAGISIRFQIGEPWWWILPDGRICLYDAAAKTAFGGNPVAIADMRQPLTGAQQALLDQAGTQLVSSTAAVTSAVRNAASTAGTTAEVMLLTFTPSLLDPAMPDARRANLPTGWASPAFDRLQVEDYDWLTAGATANRLAAYQTLNSRLGYPANQQDYLAGFVFLPSQVGEWARIDAGIDEALARSTHEVFVWALPQICRDGFLRLPQNKDADDMIAFDDVLYPLSLGLDAKIAPEFSTAIITTASGFERRNSLWSDARLNFDVGPGIRSEADLGTLIAFFRARRGAARGFRLADPSDFSSHGMTAVPTANDQIIGTGDGTSTSFALIKAYGAMTDPQLRRITRPRAGTVVVSLNGAPQASGWSLGAAGTITFTAPPATGAVIGAGYLFDVPVRFAEDRLEINGYAFAAGEAPSVPVIEFREDA